MIRELLGHAHIGVYAHVRLQRQAIDSLSGVLGHAEEPPDELPAATLVR
ncbi:integrase [Streptomyces sp. H-KF8]